MSRIEEIKNSKNPKDLLQLLEAPLPAVRKSKELEKIPGPNRHDTVRMYMRELKKKVLTREGEYALSKSMLAGKITILKGLALSPLTATALEIWADEIEDSIKLSDVVDVPHLHKQQFGETDKKLAEMSEDLKDFTHKIRYASKNLSYTTLSQLHLKEDRLKDLQSQHEGFASKLLQLDSKFVRAADKARIPRKEFILDYKANWATKDWEHIKANSLKQELLLLDKHVNGLDKFRRTLHIISQGNHVYTSSKNSLIEHNLRLVVKIAHQYKMKTALPLADLIQEGNLGLTRSIDLFDYKKGNRLSTYASWWIKHYIIRAILTNGPVHIPISVQEQHAKVRKIRQRYPGCKPEFIAKRLRITEQRVHDLDDYMQKSISLDQPIEEDYTLAQIIPDSAPNPEDLAHNASIKRLVTNNLDLLPERSQRILSLKYQIGVDREYTLQEIADQFNLSRERIRQICESEIRRIGKRILVKSDWSPEVRSLYKKI